MLKVLNTFVTDNIHQARKNIPQGQSKLKELMQSLLASKTAVSGRYVESFHNEMNTLYSLC